MTEHPPPVLLHRPPPLPRSVHILVLMGVSGAGKSTVAAVLSDQLGWPWVEGDAFHPEPNVAKMRAGHALSDADRRPWLHEIAKWIDQRQAGGRSAVITCSALKRSYRDFLRLDRPSLCFVHLFVPPAVLAARLQHRPGHFMPPSLLADQLAVLEPLDSDEPGVTIDGTAAPEAVSAAIVRLLH